ncbi:MAG TPA: DUF4405 domain-containing protein [bacterium]|nr:DUF4405 domain-containing protein [bacterium]
MNLRRITSLTALFSFLVMVLTSIILYIVPQGRIAYWASWRLWGLSKEQWGAIHINTGFLFLISLVLHIIYNWKPIVLYLKNRRKKLVLFTREFTVALGLVLLCIIGTWAEIPPFSSVLDISDAIKDRAAARYGEPPYGHAELSSLKTFTDKMNMDVSRALELLRNAGFTVANEMQTMEEIAEINAVSPQALYAMMEPAVREVSVVSAVPQAMPGTPVPGTGNMTLADLCSRYNLNIREIARGLAAADIRTEDDMTLKEIGELNRMSPTDIYDRIREISLDATR